MNRMRNRREADEEVFGGKVALQNLDANTKVILIKMFKLFPVKKTRRIGPWFKDGIRKTSYDQFSYYPRQT